MSTRRRRLRLHAEAEIVAVEIAQVEIAHPVRVLLRLPLDACAARDELAEERVDVAVDEDVDRALARLPLGVAGGLKVNDRAVALEAGVEHRRAVGESDLEP